jgi:hypothetical protein
MIHTGMTAKRPRTFAELHIIASRSVSDLSSPAENLHIAVPTSAAAAMLTCGHHVHRVVQQCTHKAGATWAYSHDADSVKQCS